MVKTRPGQCSNNSSVLKVNTNVGFIAFILQSHFASALGKGCENSQNYSTLSLTKPKVILLNFTFEVICPVQDFSFLNSALIKEK